MAGGENGVIYHMRLLILLGALAAVGAAGAENTSPEPAVRQPAMEPYLGLAVPVPDTVPTLTAPLEAAPYIPNGSYALSLVVDKKGRVKKLRYSPDSAAYYAPVQEVYKQVRFRFLDGVKIGFPLNVPAMVDYANAGMAVRKISLRFPISPDSISDAPLLTRLFAENKIDPPAISYLPPVFYLISPDRKADDCPTITARVSLDAAGTVENLEFPFPGGEGMTHPLQAALINAAFTPARKNGKPFPCDFYVTFRIFDNLRYPFTPFRPADSAVTGPMAGKYFMTIYFNDRDIAIFPLPRRFAEGVISAGVSSRGIYGTIPAEVMIGPDGKMGRVNISGGERKQIDAARRALQLTEWYPARNNRGEAEWFFGRVKVTFDGSSKVVYVPEWIVR